MEYVWGLQSVVVWQSLFDVGVAATAMNSCTAPKDVLNLHTVRSEHVLSENSVFAVDSYCVAVLHVVRGAQTLSEVAVGR